MVVCARERHAYSDTSDSIRHLETVLVPRVSATYLDTMCTSFKASERDPRIRQAYFIGEPTRHIEEACAKISSELIDRISIDVGFPPLADDFPAYFVNEFVWPLAVNRVRRYVCIFVLWREVLISLLNLADQSQSLLFSHHLQPDKDFLDHLRVDHGKLVDDEGGDFAQVSVNSDVWPARESSLTYHHLYRAKNEVSTYGLRSANGDPKPVFRAERLLWHEFFRRVYSDADEEKEFDKDEFSRRAAESQKEWVQKSFRGVSPIVFGNTTCLPAATVREMEERYQQALAEVTTTASGPPVRLIVRRVPQSSEKDQQIQQEIPKGSGRDEDREEEERDDGEAANSAGALRVHATLRLLCVCTQHCICFACARDTCYGLRAYATFLKFLHAHEAYICFLQPTSFQKEYFMSDANPSNPKTEGINAGEGEGVPSNESGPVLRVGGDHDYANPQNVGGNGNAGVEAEVEAEVEVDEKAGIDEKAEAEEGVEEEDEEDEEGEEEAQGDETEVQAAPQNIGGSDVRMGELVAVGEGKEEVEEEAKRGGEEEAEVVPQSVCGDDVGRGEPKAEGEAEGKGEVEEEVKHGGDDEAMLVVDHVEGGKPISVEDAEGADHVMEEGTDQKEDKLDTMEMQADQGGEVLVPPLLLSKLALVDFAGMLRVHANRNFGCLRTQIFWNTYMYMQLVILYACARILFCQRPSKTRLGMKPLVSAMSSML